MAQNKSRKEHDSTETRQSPAADQGELKPDESEGGLLQIRMYRQGLGDCFLLSIKQKEEQNTKPKEEPNAFHILIDCGVHSWQKNGGDRLRQVMKNIREVTGGCLDIVVGTHEHVDHLSGFVLKKSPFLKEHTNGGFKIKKFYAAWTEKVGDDVADALRSKHGTARHIIDKAMEKYESLKSTAVNLDEHVPYQQLKAVHDFHTIPMQAISKDLQDIIEELKSRPANKQIAEDIERDGIIRQGTGGYAGQAGVEQERTEPTMCEFAINLLRLRAEHTCYCTPGEVIPIMNQPQLRAYVLGPPTDVTLLKKDLPTKVRGEKDEHGHSSYHETYLTPSANLSGFAYSPALGIDGGLPDYIRKPFDQLGWEINSRGNLNPYPKKTKEQSKDESEKELKKKWKDARSFLKQNYQAQGQDWRKIDSDWLMSANTLGLHLDSDTNNTSLVLALETGNPGEGDVFLFVGDAQVGNWISWRNLKFQVDGKTIDTLDLLKRTRLYKVGHHGSHNATVKRYYNKDDESGQNGTAYGLELMEDIIAMIPVSHLTVANRWEMPHKPLYERLREKAKRRILRSDMRMEPLNSSDGEDCRPVATGFEDIPDQSSRRVFDNWKWRMSTSNFNPMQSESGDPLYYEIQIPLK
ncbi:MAG: hypothetical protein KDA74_04330 [Planctomycetaceae bacterium]|nr:hypothetical protein [Planctomycetaceae bacterium]